MEELIQNRRAAPVGQAKAGAGMTVGPVGGLAGGSGGGGLAGVSVRCPAASRPSAWTPAQITQFVPIISSFVQDKSEDDAKYLLESALN